MVGENIVIVSLIADFSYSGWRLPSAEYYNLNNADIFIPPVMNVPEEEWDVQTSGGRWLGGNKLLYCKRQKL